MLVIIKTLVKTVFMITSRWKTRSIKIKSFSLILSLRFLEDIFFQFFELILQCLAYVFKRKYIGLAIFLFRSNVAHLSIRWVDTPAYLKEFLRGLWYFCVQRCKLLICKRSLKWFIRRSFHSLTLDWIGVHSGRL